MATSSVSGSSNNASIQALLDEVNNRQTKSASTNSVTQDRFLTLLTTQLRNQDPLNPMDNAQMTSQLAQISTVDGIEKLNATLQKMLTGSTDAQAMQAAALVGHQVMVAGSGLTLTDAGAVGGVELTAAADRVTVTIKDANGLLIKTVPLGDLEAGVHDFAWDGTNNAGAKVTTGAYRISVAAERGGEKVDATALQLAQVNSVSRTGQDLSLDVAGFGQLTMADIKQLF